MHIFDLYFATIVGMNEHPGSGTQEHQKKTLEECASLAIDMMIIRERLEIEKEETSCLSASAH